MGAKLGRWRGGGSVNQVHLPYILGVSQILAKDSAAVQEKVEKHWVREKNSVSGRFLPAGQQAVFWITSRNPYRVPGGRGGVVRRQKLQGWPPAAAGADLNAHPALRTPPAPDPPGEPGRRQGLQIRPEGVANGVLRAWVPRRKRTVSTGKPRRGQVPMQQGGISLIRGGLVNSLSFPWSEAHELRAGPDCFPAPGAQLCKIQLFSMRRRYRNLGHGSLSSRISHPLTGHGPEPRLRGNALPPSSPRDRPTRRRSAVSRVFI